MGYRKDIQVLRGIAVLMVVFFHLEVAGLSSGFLGVDVFFVISGYLMAQMYAPSDKAGFFAKRARRLLPAYFATVIATVLVCALKVAPNDYKQVSDQALFASVFASNMGFWLQNSYFNKEEFKPLLHLWSLGVEIQFYLALPLLHWIFTRIRFSFGVILLGSLACCFALLSITTKTAFFWMPFRMWEFLLGYGIVKYLSRPETDNRVALWFGAAALLGVIGLPLMKVDGSAMGFVRGHPGLMALAISLCTAVTLWCGWPRKLLENPVARGLEKAGDYSYSIYLAHFPVIVVFLYKPFSGTVLKAHDWADTAMLAASVALASTLLFTLIEKPFRSRRFSVRWLGVAAFATAVLCPVGALVQRQLVAPQDMLVYEAWFDRDVFRCGTSYRMLHPLSLSCQIGDDLEAPAKRVLLVGNSHADSIKSAFSRATRSVNMVEFFIADNGPLMPGGLDPQGVIGEARKVGAQALVLHYAPNTIDVDVLLRMAKLARESRLPMALIMPVPVWDTHVPKMILQSRLGAVQLPSSTLEDYQQRNRALIGVLPALRAEHVKVYEVADRFCHPRCDMMSDAGKPLYYDSGHLTLTGSAKLEQVFEQVVQDLGPADSEGAAGVDDPGPSAGQAPGAG